MAKRLLIRVDDTVLFDGDVTELQWTQSDGSVTARGVLQRDSGSGGRRGSASLLDALAAAAASRRSTPSAAGVAEPDAGSEDVGAGVDVDGSVVVVEGGSS